MRLTTLLLLTAAASAAAAAGGVASVSAALVGITSMSAAAAAGAAADPPVLDMSKVPIEERALHTPPLDELAKVLSAGLRATFAEVAVSAAECPDLTQPPYQLAVPGLCGSPKLVELGGVPYLVPLVQRERLYELRALLAAAGRPRGALLGAGAGPWPHLARNCEGIVNLSVREGAVVQRSRAAWVDPVGAAPAAARYRVKLLPADETRAALLGNYLLTDGDQGKVLKVVACNRTGEANFITAIRETLRQHYGDQVIGLGGVFVLRGSAAHYHVMPDFSETPLTDDAAVNQWLHFLPAPPPTVNVGTLVSGDMGLDLRVQHFHGWSVSGAVGGHYHYDVAPAAAHYEAYLAPAAAVLRVDRPPHTHAVGRD